MSYFYFVQLFLLFEAAGRSSPLVIGLYLASFALGLYVLVAYTFTVENFPARALSTDFVLPNLKSCIPCCDEYIPDTVWLCFDTDRYFTS